MRTRGSSIDEVRQFGGLVNVCGFSSFRLALDLLFHATVRHGMLRIQRKANGEVVFTLSGRIDNEHIAELEALIGVEGKHRRIVLDLKDMTLTGQDGINFLAQCEAADMTLVNCDPYVREWINRQETERNAP
jgi:anti-anti-sigma regulatory factor